MRLKSARGVRQTAGYLLGDRFSFSGRPFVRRACGPPALIILEIDIGQNVLASVQYSGDLSDLLRLNLLYAFEGEAGFGPNGR